MFTKLKLGEEFGGYVPESNLIEFTCRDCAKAWGKKTGESVRIFHRFNFAGELIETVRQPIWECGPAPETGAE